MTRPKMTGINVTYRTAHYRMVVGPSSLPDAGDLDVYKIQNTDTGVIEYECTFFYEGLAYLSGLEEKYVQAIEEFEKDRIDTPEVH